MGKGRQTAPSDMTQRTTNLPEYADPYFRRLLQGAEEALMPFDPETGASTYIPYQGERIAPSEMYGDIMTSRSMVRGIAESGIPGMEEAMGATRRAMSGLEDAAKYETGEFTPFGEFEQYQFRAPFEFSQFDFRPEFQYQQPETFTGAAVEQYMSPYMQAVVDQQKQQAQLDFERQRAGRAAQAVQAGAFGGSRQAVQEALAEEALGRQMGDIQATGTQQAFQQASQQFQADRAARMAVEQQRAAEQARVDQARYTELANRQSAQAAELARAGNAEAAEAARVQAARYEDLARRQGAIEQSRQFGAGQALAGYQALASTASGLAALGERQRAADIQGAQLLETVGRDIRAEDQARLDMAYEDFVRQRDYPIQQYERMAGILRGIPVTPNVEEQRFVSYNPVQQALGAGISALGLYKGLTA